MTDTMINPAAASAQAAAQAAAPHILDARRTLIIGIGSTGAKICNQILERLIWTYGSPNYIPWLRCVVLETAPVDSNLPVTQHARFHHLKINRKDYSRLIATPQNYQDLLAFSDWNIPELTGSADQIEDGAMNTRILGRLALLFPGNFQAVRNEITQALDHLATGRLTDAIATQKFKPAVTHNPPPVELSPQTYVYVVGTLCGGTGSGTFIDLGYLLKALPGYNIAATGIFLLPSAAENNPQLLANAYASLIELNHYSTDRARYSVQYPDLPGSPGVPWTPPAAGERPYQNLYLTQPRGATKGDYAQMITASADYIYADLIGSAAAVRDGQRTNISSQFVQRDYWGATQKFFTFGVSSIEFPYAKVAKACVLRLGKKGFQQLISGDPLAEVEGKNALAAMPLLSRDRLTQRLLRRENGTLDKIMDQAVADGGTNALQQDIAMTLIRQQVGAAFEGNIQDAHPQLPARVVPQTIEVNSRAAETEMFDSIREGVAHLLLAPNMRGLPAALSLLNTLETTLKAAHDNANATTIANQVTDLSAELDDVQEKVIHCRRDFFLKVTGQTHTAVQRYVNEFVDIATEMYRKRLQVACAPTCQRLFQQALEYTQAIRRRIGDPTLGLLAEVHGIIAKMDDLYNRTNVTTGAAEDGWKRVINGKELFDPLHTVNEEYQKCIYETGRQQQQDRKVDEIEIMLAQETVQEYVQNALADLFASPNEIKRFDPTAGKIPPEINDNHLLELARPARRILEPLKSRSVVDRLMRRQDIPVVLGDANDKSELFLDWANNDARYVDHPLKSYGFVFYNEDDVQAEAFNEALVTAGIINPKVHAINMADRQQVLLLREQGAFSLGTVGNLRDEQFSHWRNAYENRRGIASFHARGDIDEWIAWTKADEEARVRIRNVFLVALALEIIEFESASRYAFHYPPTSFADPGVIYFSNDLDEAAQKIKRKKLEGELNVKIRQKRNELGDPAVVNRIGDMIKSKDGVFREGDDRLSSWDLQAYLMDYIADDVSLQDIYAQMMPDTVAQSCARVENGQQTYFCNNVGCGRKLGYTADSLYMRVKKGNLLVRERRCFHCNKDIN